ncbi:MAG: hypothetical protein EOP07_10830 [Proteobacteria bacterium]|nr:MAG: hypothetical protein EOP07_10830 [Pseudomonadota bacterium]
MPDSSVIYDYLNNHHSNERLSILSKMREKEEWFPISLSSDLLRLKLHHEEHIAILHATQSKQRLVFEDYITSQIGHWDQNVAAAALWEWALRSDCIMWHRTLPLSTSALSTQRIRYTLADLAWYGGGYALLQHLVNTEGMEEMSVAYHALLCFRALQFDIKSDRLLKLAKDAFMSDSAHPSVAPEKTMPYYLAYLYRYDNSWLKDHQTSHGLSSIWSQFTKSLVDEKTVEKDLKAFLALRDKDFKKADQKAFIRLWPSVWDRHLLTSDHLCFAFKVMAENPWPEIQHWEFIAGIPQTTLSEALTKIDDPKAFILALNLAGSFLDIEKQAPFVDKLRTVLQSASDPSQLLTTVLPRYSALLNASGKDSVFAKIFTERQAMLKAFRSGESSEIQGLGIWEKDFTPDESNRQAFFSMAYNGKKTEDIKGTDFWAQMIQCWNKPSPEKIDGLATIARQEPHLFHLCFIDTMGRFKGADNAALKLLDYIRSKEEPVLRSVVYALQGIGTVRASQELVAFLTRPNINAMLQLEIAQLLKERDVSHLQAELRSALNDLHFRSMTDSLHIGLHDAITSLLLIEEPAKASKAAPNSGNTPTTADLDSLLERKIKRYGELSSEVKRALRTAQFFHIQVEKVQDRLETIDLSPTIDMQYKALEICFREKFEDAAGELIRKGALQRKLDIIGYARPIPQAMDDYEMYIENLPIVNTIPFFSRFKLRKMLRAICQYRPGKRFTLDGLKAFALFFICFSRKDCRYGLSEQFKIRNMSNDELLLFCKELHVFQDFRNRAAHEGFHPDASNNLDSIWDRTATIIEGMFLIADGLEESDAPKILLKSS